ncbi:putative acetate kinase protein [Botrytis fragariae]|uniref:Probable acetate kinase n=1 Tax=Botrytis fragariae TaxID=1964551 RepID=A0A8H6ECL4_9HELO|nr:putative acetate kinase protein [Botrytis fragariae]KAF5867572.1 putative acetate kinase protein [Botrytis fragariae]
MSKIILSINAGSSSVKISIFSASQGDPSPKPLAEAQISGLTSPPPTLKYSRGGKSITKNQKLDSNITDQNSAFQYILTHLINDSSFPQISQLTDISLASHRVVHGGDYQTSQLITRETLHHLETLTDLAPLHNASALSIIQHCITHLPSTRNIAVFDSQFHATIPEHISTYPIDQEIAKKNGLRKYGFHGISYAFITRSVAEFLGKKEEETNIIALHLGSGASACVVKNGKSWDTSMGLTPLAGLPGATRSGSLDPSLVFHYATNVGKLSPNSTSSLHISRAEEILNKESGWKSLTGTTDFGTITSSSSSDPTMKLAFDIFVDRILSYIGHYYISLHGNIDAGIGEKSEVLRERVGEEIRCLGFEIDGERNAREIEGTVQEIGKEGAKHRMLVCKTDEQFEMARHCVVDEGLFGE